MKKHFQAYEKVASKQAALEIRYIGSGEWSLRSSPTQIENAVRRALKGQPAPSPGQSEATPWVVSFFHSFRPERAKA